MIRLRSCSAYVMRCAHCYIKVIINLRYKIEILNTMIWLAAAISSEGCGLPVPGLTN